jgi:imidazolonepropionase-like amidohydrolase
MATECGILLEGGTLIDGTGAEPREGVPVLLVGDRIAAVGPDCATRAATLERDGALERVDVAGQVVMPGLIDAHCHITFGEPSSNDELFFHRREGYSALLAAFNVQKLLLAGVTGFLDADVLWNLGVELRDAIEAGIAEGPRMVCGGSALLTAVGGTAGQLIPNEGNRGYARIVQTRDEMTIETRKQIKNGVDWIKIHATGLIPRQSQAG